MLMLWLKFQGDGSARQVISATAGEAVWAASAGNTLCCLSSTNTLDVYEWSERTQKFQKTQTSCEFRGRSSGMPSFPKESHPYICVGMSVSHI
jgi:hypothetical protein